MVSPRGHYVEASKQADMDQFVVRTTGGRQNSKAFSAVFCNSTGMFAYYSSMPGNCFYQRSTCDRKGFQYALNFLHDDTLSLMANGIDPKATRLKGASGEVVWDVRSRTCSNTSIMDNNVTFASDSVTLIGWAKGGAVVDPISRSCSVHYTTETISHFLPTTEIDSTKVEAFAMGRIDSEGLYCSTE